MAIILSLESPIRQQIDELAGAHDDTTISLFTFQHADVAKKLEQGDRHVASSQFAFMKNYPGKKMAYNWMTTQMNNRLIGEGCDLPIWALPVRLPCPIEPTDRLIKINVPKSRVLFSFYAPWENMLSCFSEIEKTGGVWPKRWFSQPYITANSSDEQYLQSNGFIVPNETACRSSWEKIFDLSLISTIGFKWSNSPYLQAVLNYIDADDVE